jgi:CheY-like chemotaxis protein
MAREFDGAPRIDWRRPALSVHKGRNSHMREASSASMPLHGTLTRAWEFSRMPDTIAGPAVLVVEDEVLIRLAIADSIADSGLTVYQAANADQAIHMLELHPDIRALFTDIDMPGSMDGLRLARAVRDRWPPVKIVITSGHVKIKHEELPVEGRFFAKPYDADKVVRTLRDLVGA